MLVAGIFPSFKIVVNSFLLSSSVESKFIFNEFLSMLPKTSDFQIHLDKDI